MQLNKEEILKELGDLPEEMYDEIVLDFITQANEEIISMKEALNNNDFDSVSKIAHSIKGSSGNLRIYDVQLISRSIETEAKVMKNKDSLEQQIIFLEQSVDRIKKN